MTKWTRGPWRWDVQDGEIYGQPDDVVVVYRGGLQFESDADLIAAAPELYSELELLVETFDGYQGMKMIKAKTVLAKARGES